jgi:fatty acid desaturase
MNAGILFFVFMLVLAFWVLIFLASFVPFMAVGLLLDYYFPELSEKIFGNKEE